MRVIIFDRELHEPLTIVDVPHWLAERAKEGDPIVLLPPPPPMDVRIYPPTDTEIVDLQKVVLTFEQVRRSTGRRRLDGSHESETLFWYAYADDPETALLLRCAFLPGQVGEVQRLQKRAYVMGLFGQ